MQEIIEYGQFVKKRLFLQLIPKGVIHIAKVFFACPVWKSRQFSTTRDKSFTLSLSMIVSSGGPLAAMYFISSGCEVRLYIPSLRCRERPDRIYETGFTLFVYNYFECQGAWQLNDVQAHSDMNCAEAPTKSCPTIFYRPSWTCGKYNRNKHVALMYNLLAGYSFFFENYSADVINIILRAGREGQFSTLNIANETGLAMESISSFMEVLEQNGLITQSMPTNEDIETYRKRLAEMKKKQPSWTDTDVKDKLPMNISNAELAYSEAIDDGKTITSVMFELTYRCSEMCIHCYNPGATRNSEEISHRAECKELTLDDYKRIIDELCDLGLVKACLSGGDPFSKEITFDIIDYLYSKDIAIDIFTNGQRITKYVRKIAEYFPRLIGISIYSGIPEDHDAITRVNGSWRRSIQVVQELSELAVPMNLKCCIMQPNLHSYYLVAELARQYGAQPQFEINISESNDGDLCAKQLRLTEEQLQIVLRDHNLPLYVGREAPNFGGQKRDMFLRSCGAGTTGFCISPNGDFRACTAFIQVYGNLKETSALAILLHSDKLKEWRDSKVADYSECGRYGYCDYCNLCSGLNYTEHKDFRKPAETNCYMARARYNLAQKLMESDTPLNREEFVEALQKLPKAKVVLQRKYKTKG